MAPATSPPVTNAPVVGVSSILVYVGLDLIGDGLMKLPFLRALRAAFPAAHITWLAGKGRTVYAHELAPLTVGLLNETIENAGIGSRFGELFESPLAGRRFDLVIDTQRRVLTTLIVKRIAHGRFISAGAGYLFSDAAPLQRAKPPAMIRQLLDLVEVASGRPAQPHGGPRLPEDYLDAARRLLPDGPTYIGLAPGAGGRHKCWPLENFALIALAQQKAGRVPAFILGPNEKEWEKDLRAAVPGARFPLQEAGSRNPLLTMTVAQRLRAAVANDSGAGHLLASGGASLVSLFGPTPPAKFAPLAPRLEIVTAQQFGGDTMDKIPVTAVSAAIEKLLKPPPQRPSPAR